MKKLLVKTFKVFLWIIGSFIFLIVLLIVALQLPATQNFITGKAVDFLSKKTKTKVALGGINVAFPKYILLKEFYIEDRERDTLLYSHSLKVDFDFWGLLSKKIELNAVVLDKITAHINRTLPDSSFNFDFIAKSFASDSTDTASDREKDSTGSGWKFSILEVRLKDIYLTYDDQVSGNNANLRLGYFKTELNEFDLDSMIFKVEDVELKNTRLSLIQSKPSVEDKDTAEVKIDFGLEKIKLADIHINYENKFEPQKLVLDLDKSELLVDEINLDRETIQLNKFSLYNTSILYSIGKKAKEKIKQETKEVKDTITTPGANWKIILGSLDLKNNNLKFDDFNQRELASGVDFSHLDVKGITINVDNIAFNKNKSSATINEISLNDKSGFQIKDLSTHVILDSVHAVLSDLNLQTGNSRINELISIGYSSLETIGDSIGDLKITADLKNTEVAVADILYFVPDLGKQPIFSKNTGTIVKIKTKITGTVNDILIGGLEMSIGNGTFVKAGGSIKGLPDINKANFNILLSDFSTGKTAVKQLIPEKMVPVNVPDHLNLKGYFKGKIKHFDAKADLKTTIGNILAQVRMFPVNGKDGYNADVSVDNFNLGILLNQPATFGPTTLNVKVEGAGLDTNTLDANIHAKVKKVVLNRYEYNNLSLDAQAIKQRFIAKAKLDDNNLAFILDGDINLEKTKEKYKLNFDLQGSDLKALNLTDDDIRVSGKLVTDIQGNQVKTVNGKLGIRKLLIIKNGKEYPVDSLLFASINGDGKTNLSLESHIVSGKFDGNLSLADLPEVLSQHLSSYFKRYGDTIKTNLKAQNFNFSLEIKDPALLKEVLVPGLNELSTVVINGSYSSTDKKLIVDMNAPLIDYSGIKVDSLKINVNSDPAKLSYSVNIDKVSNASVKLENTALTGDVKNDSIRVSLNVEKPDKTRSLFLAGLLNKVTDGYRFKFDQDGVILNNEQWTVSPDNYLTFGKTKFLANNVKISKSDEDILINNLSGTKVIPLMVKLSNFDLYELSQIIQKDTLMFSGLLNGKIVLEDKGNQSALTSDLKITDFSYFGDTLGNISLMADNKGLNLYNLNLAITGHSNDIKVNGKYYTSTNNNNLNFDIDINPLNLASVESYTAGQIKRLTGELRGKLKLTGSSSAPILNGDLAFKNSGLHPVFLNSYLRLEDEHIVFNPKGISFKSFTLVDSLNNKAIINGNLITHNYVDYIFNLNINTNNFLALNTKAGDNPLFFGKVFLDSKINLKGDLDQPKVNVSATIKDGTDLTFVKPESEIAAEDHEGIVQFIDKDKNLHPIMEEGLHVKADTTKNIKGLDLTVDLGINDKTALKVLVDQASGDSLYLRGNANMSFSLDPSGKTSLGGDYEVEKGSYGLTLSEVVKKEFVLEKGSKIVWTGDPTSATLDIKAIYTAKTSPLGLIEDQVKGMSEDQMSAYKKQLPFQVLLNIKGELMKPEITFDLNMPEQYRGELDGAVYAKILQVREDPSELNQQVFSLLVLDRFMTSDPLANPGSVGLASSARSSVSKVLADQLNNLSGKYVKGVDLNIGVESGEATGGTKNTTQVQVGVSKQLFDDKVKVQVGGNVDVEGTKTDKNTLNNVVGDVSIEYKLSDDGRYLLKGVRKTQYEGAIEGELTRTGVSVIYVKDYNKFNEVFNKPDKKEEGKTKP